MNTPDAEPKGGPKPVDAQAPSPPSTPPMAGADPEFDVRLRRATRRGFATAGISILAGYGAWRWLIDRPERDGLIWPLRRVLEANERLAIGTIRPSRLAPDFDRSLARTPRVNELIGMAEQGITIDPSIWRLDVGGGPLERGQRLIGLDEIKAHPRFEQTTELKCIEGWSTVVSWAGVRLADLAASTGLASRSGGPYAPARTPDDLYRYVSLATPSKEYYVGLDMPSALHPQTLLCYEMNGKPLSVDHGAPLRLVIPLKYGIKNIKQIGAIRFTDRRPVDYWAERGYDWYAGH